MKRKICIMSLLLITLNLFASENGNEIKLNLVWDKTGKNAYYFELLEKSLALIGYKAKINKLEDMPRARKNRLLDSGKLTLYWFFETDERDEKFVQVDAEIANNLVGQRVFLIPKNSQVEYNEITSVTDLRLSGKTAGFGWGWYDISVWEDNDLSYIEQTEDWHYLYSLTASKSRRVDCFSRSITEVLFEYEGINNELDIENNLLFSYEADFKFYLGKANEDKREILEKALITAKETGLMDMLIEKHWGAAFKALKLDKRKLIKMNT